MHVITGKPGPAESLLGRKHLERRVLGSDGTELVVGGGWAGALEEDADLCLPPLEVGEQHWHLLVRGEFAAAEWLRALAQAQLARARGSQVAHPLRLTTGRDKIA